MPSIQRREFLAGSLAATASLWTAGRGWAEAPANGRQFTMALHCGAIGVQADLGRSIELAAEHGFEAVEPRAGDLAGMSDDQRKTLLDDMRAKGLVWSVAGLPVNFRQDEAAFVDGLKKLPELAQALQAVSVDRMGTWISPSHPELTYLRNFSLHAKRLAAVARILEDHGIRLGLEYVGPKTSWSAKRYPFIHTLHETKELVAEMDRPNVGITLDSWHWYTAQETAEDILSLDGSDVISVHLNDAPKGIPVEEQNDSVRDLPTATGVIDLKTFLSSLVEVGFDGPAFCEPFKRELRELEPQEAVAKTAAAMQAALSLID